MERAHLRLSSGVKLNRFRDFAFTCRRVENTDSHKCVPGKRSNYGRASLDNRQTPSAKITNFISFEHVFGPRLVPKVDEFIFHAIRNIFRLEQQNDFSPNPSLFWWFREITAQIPYEALQGVEQLSMLYQYSLHHQPPWQDSRTSKISCLSFSLSIVKFFHECAEVSVKSTIVLPLLCSFRLTLLSCWNMSARYSRRELKWLLSWQGTISFFPWSLRICFNSYRAKLHTARCVHLSLLLCILNQPDMFGNLKHTDR